MSFTHLNTLLRGTYHSSHFTDKETKAPRSEVVYLCPTARIAGESRLKAGCLRVCTLQMLLGTPHTVRENFAEGGLVLRHSL